MGQLLRSDQDAIRAVLHGFVDRLRNQPPVHLLWNFSSSHGEAALLTDLHAELNDVLHDDGGNTVPPDGGGSTVGSTAAGLEGSAGREAAADGSSTAGCAGPSISVSNHPSLEADLSAKGVTDAVRYALVALCVMLPVCFYTGASCCLCASTQVRDSTLAGRAPERALPMPTENTLPAICLSGPNSSFILS